MLAVIFAAASCRRGNADTQPPPAAVAATAAPPALVAPPPRGLQLTLAYSSNLLAAYETCGCPGHPMGGLARRATQLDRARAEADAVLVLEAGDLFSPAPIKGTPPPAASEIERRARLLAAAYGRMGTTALVPGERDLALGVPLLRRLAKQAGLPLVASNLHDRTGEPLFATDRIVDAKGIKIGLLGLTAPPTPADAAAWAKAGVEARDPIAAARATVASLRARGAQLVIALLHLPTEAESRKLLATVAGVDWAVLGHVGLRTETAQQIGPEGTARLLAVMPEGKELGRADLHVVGGALAFVDRGARAELETILADHRRQLLDYDKRLGSLDPDSARDYYDSRRKQIGEAIAREQVAVAKLPPTIKGSWFENRLIPLDAETPGQVGVAVLVDAYNHESARRTAAGKPASLPGDQPAPPSIPPDASTGYTGSAACGGCHAPALAFWQATKHARSLTALTRIGKDRDPSCVGCHVTGYRQAGGPVDPASARGRFANVGCESCHGPGRTHAEAAAQASGLPKREHGTLGPVAEATCRGCHTVDRTNGDFDYAKTAAAILGPGHGKPGLAPRPKAPL